MRPTVHVQGELLQVVGGERWQEEAELGTEPEVVSFRRERADLQRFENRLEGQVTNPGVGQHREIPLEREPGHHSLDSGQCGVIGEALRSSGWGLCRLGSLESQGTPCFEMEKLGRETGLPCRGTKICDAAPRHRADASERKPQIAFSSSCSGCFSCRKKSPKQTN